MRRVSLREHAGDSPSASNSRSQCARWYARSQMSWLVFTCRICEQAHDLSQIAFDCAVRIYVEGMPANEREAGCELTDEWCVIDKEHFFVKGNLEIPDFGTNDHLVLNVWTTLSQQNFRRMMSLWDTVGRAAEPPYFGWFSNRLPAFPDTVNLKSMVRTRELGGRPISNWKRRIILCRWRTIKV